MRAGGNRRSAAETAAGGAALTYIWMIARAGRAQTSTLRRVDVCAIWERRPGPLARVPEQLRFRIASHRLLEFLGDAEGYLLARLDLDRFTGRGVASHASSAFAHLQDAKSVSNGCGSPS